MIIIIVNKKHENVVKNWLCSNYLLLLEKNGGKKTVTLCCSSCKTISTQSSSAHVEERDQELWGTLEQDCL